MTEGRPIWQVSLGGTFTAYDDPAVQSALERAYLAGERAAEVEVSGRPYVVEVVGDHPVQMAKGNPTRRRRVRRVLA